MAMVSLLNLFDFDYFLSSTLLGPITRMYYKNQIEEKLANLSEAS